MGCRLVWVYQGVYNMKIFKKVAGEVLGIIVIEKAARNILSSLLNG